MSIKSKDIDLTQDRKFKPHNKDIILTSDLMLYDHNDNGWSGTHYYHIQDTTYNRHYGDMISDEVGFTVRKTMTDNWWYCDLPKNQYNKCSPRYIIDSFLHDAIGYVDSALVYCINCGKRYINMEVLTQCPHCKQGYLYKQTYKKLFNKDKTFTVDNNRGRIPWKDYQLILVKNGVFQIQDT